MCDRVINWLSNLCLYKVHEMESRGVAMHSERVFFHFLFVVQLRLTSRASVRMVFWFPYMCDIIQGFRFSDMRAYCHSFGRKRVCLVTLRCISGRD